MLVPMYVNFAGGSPQRGLTRRLRRGWWGCRPRGEKSFLSKRKKGPKKAGGTATPEAARPAARYSQISAFRALPCPALVICSGLPVANCLRQLCPLGTRSLSAQASACGSPSGCPLPRFALLTRRGKALDCPFLKEGVRNVARNIVGELTHAIVRARAHSYPLSKRARLFPSAAYRRSAPPRLAIDRLKWRCLRGFGAARMISQCGKTGLIFLLGWRRAYSSSAAVDILDISVTQNASVASNPRWHLLRAGGPGARRRSFLFN